MKTKTMSAFSILLMASSSLYGGLVDGKYGVAQVFDVSRSPSYPTAGNSFTASNMKAPYSDTNGQYTMENGQYIQFVINDANDDCNDIDIKLYQSNGDLNDTVATAGKVYGLDNKGFLYVSARGYGTFVSNAEGFNNGDRVTYTPSVGTANCSDLSGYSASTSVLGVGETAGGATLSANDYNYTTPINTTSTITLDWNATTSATSSDGSDLNATIKTAPTKGSASISGKNLSYTPSKDKSGSDSLILTIENSTNITKDVNITFSDINTYIRTTATKAQSVSTGYSGVTTSNTSSDSEIVVNISDGTNASAKTSKIKRDSTAINLLNMADGAIEVRPSTNTDQRVATINTNGTTEHKIIVGSKSVITTSNIIGSSVELVNGGLETNATIDSNTRASIEATSTGKTIASLIRGDKTTTTQVDIIGAQTSIETNGTVETNMTVDKSGVEFKVKTTTTKDGNTTSYIETNGVKYYTVSPSTPLPAGSKMRVYQASDNTIYVEVNATIDQNSTLIIE
jgi:hypothetical protein